MKLLNNKQKQSSHAQRIYGKTIFSYLAAAVLALSSVLFLTSCWESGKDRAENVGGVTARQVIENPSAYIGKNVTVSGDVEEIHGPRAFNLDSGLSIGELLVLGREPFPQIPEAGNRAFVVSDVATVTGTVRMLVAAEVEREIGWDLDPQIEAEFNSKPVLIAQSVSFRPGAGGTRSSTAEGNGGQTTANTTANPNVSQPSANNNMSQMPVNTNATPSATSDRITDPGVYASTADKLSLVGKETQFSNLRVTRVVGPRTFTVASGNSEMYVMLDEESARGVGTSGKIGVGTTLSLTGRFERLQAEEINNITSNRFRALTEQERAFLKNTPIFLQADKVNDLK